MTEPSVLVVSGLGVTGRTNGSKVRLIATLRGLSRVGAVDLLQWGSRPWRRRVPAVRAGQPVPPLRSLVHVVRHTTPDRLRPVHRLGWTARAMAQPGPPILPYAVSCAAAPRPATIEQGVPGLRGYDLVWCFELPSGVAIDHVTDRPPAILDAEAVHHLFDDDGSPPPAATHGADRVHDAFRRSEQRAVRHCIEDLSARFASVVFTNPVEAAAFDLPNGEVLHNGCDVPPYRGAREVHDRPTFTFVGWMAYGPNEEAARYLVAEIVPQMRRRLGSAFEVRIVGSAPPAVERLASDPNVVVTGYVDDLASELDRADVVVAPIRSGAGTRLKIIEAFAHQVPVVSTTFGASGLDVADRRHLLLADTSEAFAAACEELLTDQPLRRDLVANAHALAERDHSWPAIEARVAALALSAMVGRDADDG